jgi:hypothetical protein
MRLVRSRNKLGTKENSFVYSIPRKKICRVVLCHETIQAAAKSAKFNGNWPRPDLNVIWFSGQKEFFEIMQ